MVVRFMDLFLKEDKRILLVPAFLSFIIALLLLYKYAYPISWDVYYHMHMIELYMQNGLVFWDYATVAPKGRLIMYPPLFHLVFAELSKLLNISSAELCRISQPLFSFYLIGTITYVSYKLSDVRTAFFTGLLSMLCFITFNRSVICTPATIAIGLSMISCLFVYLAIDENNMKYLILSAMALALLWNLHMATAILTCGVVALYSFIQLVVHKISVKYLMLYVITVILLGMPWWIYIAINYTLVFNSLPGANLLITDFFFKYYGITETLLLFVGYYVLIKEKNSRTLFLMVWTLSLLLLSQSYLLGFNIVSIRILEVLSYPLILVSGMGLDYLYGEYLQNIRLKKILIILLIVFSLTSALLYVDSYTPDILNENDHEGTVISENIHLLVNPVKTMFKPTVISSRFANNTLAHDRYDVMKYFVRENTSDIVVSEDAIMDTIIVSNTNASVVYGGFTESIPEYVTDPVHIIKGWSNKNELSQLNVGYLLLKENTTVPYYAEQVYNNTNYKICKIKNEYR